MKVSKIMRGIVFCLVAALLAGLVSIPRARADNSPGKTQEYDIDQPVEEFPIMRGSPDWERLGLDEFAADSWKSADHIPQPVQERMTTRALLLTYLNHPAAKDCTRMGVYDLEAWRIYNSAKKVRLDNGILETFENRDDAPHVLLNEIRAWGEMPANELEHLSRNMHTINPLNMVTIIVQKEYTSRMTKDEMYDFVKLMISYRKRSYEEFRILNVMGNEFLIYANIVKGFKYRGLYGWAPLTDEEALEVHDNNPMWVHVSSDYFLDLYRGYYTGT